MVCVFCLIPLFLIPIVNLLPILFDILMARIYRLLGWEYRKPERVPPACPFKPAAGQKDAIVGEDIKLMHEKMGVATDIPATTTPVDNGKQD
ncbi:hypothetical protein MKW94_007062 [Papaver nudicaule]|uniref:Uncharacterized protein n=1 Tax=Papaver nudicaule TaxID=74823 RepID=A0AA41SIL0_PAPNU|nr:hypothetical protein [Papaver nudicaule]